MSMYGKWLLSSEFYLSSIVTYIIICMLLYYTANINIQHWILENPLNIVNIILFLFLHPRLYYKKYMFLNINIFPYCRFCKNVFSWFARVLHEILCVCASIQGSLLHMKVWIENTKFASIEMRKQQYYYYMTYVKLP
jgi:hypothetical protein